METCFYNPLIFVLFTLVLSGITTEACSPSGSPCTKNEDCCSISNGKPYCEGGTGRCSALRHCNKSSPETCPFNDLSASEIQNVIKLIENYKPIGTNRQLTNIRKQEPKKIQWNAGNPATFERIAYATVFDADRNWLWEVMVSLTRQKVISASYRTDSTPPMTTYESIIAQNVVIKDGRFVQAYQDRGLNVSNARIDIWADGNIPGKRQVTIIFCCVDPGSGLIYWQPVEGLQMRIDIATKRVLEFVNINRNVPVPPAPHFSHSDTDHEMPAANSQPHNSTFEVEGFHVKWKNWNFQYSMDPLHGLQLYHIRHIADCEERFLIYNIKISEMFVPYGASGYTWRWREVFDTGVYGLGKNASPIMLGIDAPPYAKVLPCTKYNDLTGEVSELENCIALYERPVWPEYYHYDIGSDTHYARAGTELVIMSMCTVGNYVYMWEYVFKMDGTIMVMVMATGIVLNRAVINEKNDPNCIEECLDYINEHSIGPVHQHFVNYRIDFDIDGASNTLMQVDFVQDPRSLDNYDGGAFSARRTIIPRETFLDSSPINSRFWNIINQQSRNVFNTPRGYSIRPDSLAFTFAMDTLSKAEFVKHPIWVTLHNDDEQGAAADFPRSRKKNQGLPDYIKDGASVRNADLVFWYSLGFSHLPRPEEFPIMDTHKASLHVSPTNFHSANPLITTRC